MDDAFTTGCCRLLASRLVHCDEGEPACTPPIEPGSLHAVLARRDSGGDGTLLLWESSQAPAAHSSSVWGSAAASHGVCCPAGTIARSEGQLEHAQHAQHAAAVRLTLDLTVLGVPSLAFCPAAPQGGGDDPMAAEFSSTPQEQQHPKRRRVGDMTSPTASPSPHSFVVTTCGSRAGISASAPNLAIPVPRSFLWPHSLPGVTCSLVAERESPLSRPIPTPSSSAGAAGPSGTSTDVDPGTTAASRVAAAWQRMPAFRQLALMSGCGHALVSNPLFGVLMDSPSADGAAASFGCFLVGTQSGSVWAYPLDTAGGAQGAAVGTSASAAHPGSAVGPEQLLFDFEEPLVSLFVQAAATCTTRGSSGRDTPGSGGQAAAAGDALVMVGARGRVVHVAASRDYASLGQGAFQVLSSFLRIARPPASAGCSSSPPVPKLAVREWSLPFDVSAAAQGPGAMLALLTPGGHVYLAATAAATVAAGSAAPAGGDGGAQGSGVALHVVRLLAPGPVAALDWELPRRTHSHAHPRQQQQQQQGPALVLRTASGAVLASQPWHVAAGSGGEGATAAGGELALLPAVWRGVVEAAGLGSQQARDGGACGGSGGGSGAASASACWPCMPLLGEPLPLRSAPALARALRATVAQLSRGRSNADTLRSQMHAAARRLEASGRDAAALRAVAAHGGCLADCGSSGGGGGGIGAELSVPLLLPGGGGRGSPPQLQVTALVALPAGASGSGGVDGAGSSSGGSRGGAWQLVVRWVPDDVRMAASVASCRVDQGGAGAPPSGGGGVSTGEPPRAVLLLLPLVPSEQGGRGGVGGWLQAFAVRALRRGGASTTSRGDGSGGAGTSGGGAGRTRQLAAVLLSEAYLTPTQLRMVPTLAADWLRLPHPSAGAGAARRDHSHGAPARHHGHSAALMWSLDAGAPAAGAPTAQQHSGACAAALSHVGRLLRRALGDVSGGDARAVGLARTISAADAQHFPPCAHSSGGGGGGGGAGPSHAPPAAGAGAGSDAGGEAFVVAVWGGRASVAWRVHPGCHGGAAVVAGGGGGGAPAAGAGPRAPPSSAAVAAAAAPAAAPAALMVELHLATADAHTLLSLHQALATAAAAAAARSAARSSSTRHGRGAAARGGGAVPSGAVPSASPPASTCSSLMYRPQLQPAFSRLRGLLAQLRGLQESVRAASRLRCTLDECSADAASVVDEAAVAGELQAHQASLAASLQTAYAELLAIQGGVRAQAVPSTALVV